MHETEIQNCKATVERQLNRAGSVCPVLVCFDAEGRGSHLEIAGMLGNKDFLETVVRSAIAKYTTVILITEAWFALLTPEQQEAAKAGVFLKASKQPQRREVVMFGVYQKGHEQHLCAFIERRGKKASLGPWQDLTEMAQAGRFCKVQQQQVSEVSTN